MHARAEELLCGQRDVLATWQLRAAGLTHDAAANAVRGMRRIHDGVHLHGRAPITREQRWWAAVLTAPRSVLSHASAAAAWGIRPWKAGFEVITRPGTGGPRLIGSVLVCRSRDIQHRTLNGIAITTVERTIEDLAAQLPHKEIRRMVREAIRLGLTTYDRLIAHLARSATRRRGTRHLNSYLNTIKSLQLDRCKSDAEAQAVIVLHHANEDPPNVNHVVAGHEADLSWPQRHLIIEIDGPSFHHDKVNDAAKTLAWTAAGHTVRRIPSDRVYTRPRELIALAR